MTTDENREIIGRHHSWQTLKTCMIVSTILLAMVNSAFASLDWHYSLNVGMICVNSCYALLNLAMIKFGHREFAWYWGINVWCIAWGVAGLIAGPQ